LTKIYNLLVEVEGTNKFQNLDARWEKMIKLSKECEMYLGKKQRKGQNMQATKYMTIERLKNESLAQFAKEIAKAKNYGNLVNAKSPKGLSMGERGAHKNVRYERAFLGTKNNGFVAHGNEIYDQFVQSGLTLTGDDQRDAYMLRNWLKTQVRTGNFANTGLNQLEYLKNDQERAPYELSFTATQVRQNNAVFNTSDGSFVEGELSGAPFVISEDGDWYARKGKMDIAMGKFHHSSFLAGGSVMLAGTIRTSPTGKLNYISNNSGHYSPGIDQLLDGATLILGCGLNRQSQDLVSICFRDFENFLGPQANYMFPLTLFLGYDGKVPNHANYETDSRFSEMFWMRPNAVRPQCPCGVGANGIITFPQ
jgi:hypothetical protein